MSKMLEVNTNSDSCPYSVSYIRDGVTNYDCSIVPVSIHMDFLSCNITNCPLPDYYQNDRIKQKWIDRKKEEENQKIKEM